MLHSHIHSQSIHTKVPGNRLPSLDDKPRLPYIEAVILEIIRQHTFTTTLCVTCDSQRCISVPEKTRSM